MGRLCMLISLVSSLLWRENDEAASLFLIPEREIDENKKKDLGEKIHT